MSSVEKMVNCPKCGFSQPQDQYCASCGVDMVAFVPAKKPFAQRLLSHPGTQIGAAVVIALGLTVFIRAQNETAKQKLAAEIEIAEEAERQEAELANNNESETQTSDSASISASRTNAEGDSASADTSAEESQPPATMAQGLAAQTAANTTAPALGASPAVSSASSTGPAAAAPNAMPTQLRVTFVEASRIAINELLNDARQTGGDGVIAVGVVAGYEAKLRTPAIASGWRNLDQGTVDQLRLNQPGIVAKGARDPQSGQILGFTVQAIPTLHDSEGTHVQIDIARVLRDQQGQPVSFEFALPETFVIPRGSALVIAGTLPRGSIPPQDERVYQTINVLKSLASPAFKGDVSDGAIIIDMK